MDTHTQSLPLLSRGKHRNPRRGACFMELASFLAGERWSDKPSCTHPLLAHLARLVNDLTANARRSQLAILVPSVIGLTSADERWNDELTLLAATRALPVVAEHHQRALAVGILNCEMRRAARAGQDTLSLHPASERAFAQVPLVRKWAQDFIDECGGPGQRHPGPAVMEVATVGISAACIEDPDTMLRELLTDAITLCERLAGQEPSVRTAPDPTLWRQVCKPAPTPPAPALV